MDKTASRLIGYYSYRTRSPEHIKDYIPSVSIKFYEAIDQFFRKWCRMASPLRLGRNIPKAIRESLEFFSSNISILASSFKCPGIFVENQNVFPRWDNMRICRTFQLPQAVRRPIVCLYQIISVLKIIPISLS